MLLFNHSTENEKTILQITSFLVGLTLSYYIFLFSFSVMTLNNPCHKQTNEPVAN